MWKEYLERTSELDPILITNALLGEEKNRKENEEKGTLLWKLHEILTKTIIIIIIVVVNADTMPNIVGIIAIITEEKMNKVSSDMTDVKSHIQKTR